MHTKTNSKTTLAKKSNTSNYVVDLTAITQLGDKLKILIFKGIGTNEGRANEELKSRFNYSNGLEYNF